MKEKKRINALIVGAVLYTEGIEENPWLTETEKITLDWLVDTAKKTNLFFDNEKELKEFREEVSNFAVELYRKKYNKEESQ